MEQVSAKDIVAAALKNGQLDRLLLGDEPYQYLPRGSPSPWKTDLVDLLTAFYAFDGSRSRAELRNLLYSAIDRIVEVYEGIIPVAQCVLFESVRRFEYRHTLDLPLEHIANELKLSIRKHSTQLSHDNAGPGSDWEDGLLGELRRLGKNIEEYGGPAIFSCEVGKDRQ